jgi:DNA-binding NarL/FixJ family response regulator
MEVPTLLDSTVPTATAPRHSRPAAPGGTVADDTRIRVLIVDDHAVVRMGLRVFFDLQDDITVVGEAADGSEGVAMARRLEPDVVLMDLLMPNMDGVTAIGRIKSERPETEIVTMTSFIEEEKVTAALEAGASGYVLKDAEAEEVAAAVRAAYAGEVHLDPAVARLLAQRMRARKTGEDELAEPLTDREKDVMRLLGQGMSNKEIGAALFITERTARTYVSNILGKLGLASRTQAALWAVEHKLVEPARD